MLKRVASPLRTGAVVIMLLCACACTLIPKTDTELERDMAASLRENNLRAAYDAYQALSAERQRDKAVANNYRKLRQAIAAMRDKTVQQANRAISRGDWQQASELYHAQAALIDTDAEFDASYQKFQRQLDLKKAPIKNDFLIVKARYLIQKRKAERLIQQLDPHDAANESQLAATRKEARAVSKLLLAQGLDAVQRNDISTARKLIPLAKALVNNKTARKANRALEKLTRPMEEYIEKLTELGTQLYSSEDYAGALEIWNDILYLDPNNTKIQANKERTEKVLQSLEKIKQDSERQNFPADEREVQQ